MTKKEKEMNIKLAIDFMEEIKQNKMAVQQIKKLFWSSEV